MKYNFLTKTMKKTIASALISGATVLGPSMCEKTVYSNTNQEYNVQNEISNTIDRLGKSNLEKRIKQQREYIFEQKSIEQNSDKIKAPHYKNIPPGYCARYATTASKKMFGKEYENHEAWNLRYKNKIVENLDSIGELKELVINGKLEPGMIIGIYNPKSNKNKRKDLTHNKIKYSHVMVYAGINKDNELEFIHQLGKKIEKINLSDIQELENKGWKLIEILDDSENNLEKLTQI